MPFDRCTPEGATCIAFGPAANALPSLLGPRSELRDERRSTPGRSSTDESVVRAPLPATRTLYFHGLCSPSRLHETVRCCSSSRKSLPYPSLAWPSTEVPDCLEVYPDGSADHSCFVPESTLPSVVGLRGVCNVKERLTA